MEVETKNGLQGFHVKYVGTRKCEQFKVSRERMVNLRKN